ncbi:hypothetical protein DFH06DRAFT_1443723 [Mycena polygramma]|nr:hypothetical protein DFH06DRAFT_1443723 [Mycena polygramma]
MAVGYPIQSFVSDSNAWDASWLDNLDTSFGASSTSYTSAGPSHGHPMTPNDAYMQHSTSFPDPGHWQDTRAYGHPSSDMLSSATHTDLIAANNMAYTTLLHQHNSLFAQYRALQLSIAQSGLPNSSHPPQASSSSVLTTTASTALANPKDFPNVRWWDRASYNKAQNKNKSTTLNAPAPQRGGARAAKGINVMSQYLENSDGKSVSGREAQEIRATQRSVYAQIKATTPAELPKTWGEASISVNNYHRAQMYAAHPILRLCNSHWKVDLLATTTYPSWYLKNVKNKHKSHADESEDSDSDSGDGGAEPEPVEPRKQTRKRKSTKTFTPSDQPKRQKHNKDAPTTDSELIRSPSDVDTSSVSSGTTPPPPIASSAPSASSTNPPAPPSAASSITAPAPSSSSSASSGPTPAPSSASTPSVESTQDPPTSPLAQQPRLEEQAIPSSTATESPLPAALPPSLSTALPKPFVVINPLDEEFGAATGPTQRSENIAGTADTSSIKRPNNSLSPANLFYVDYLKQNKPVTTKQFAIIFGALSEGDKKKWKQLSAKLNADKKAATAKAVEAAGQVFKLTVLIQTPPMRKGTFRQVFHRCESLYPLTNLPSDDYSTESPSMRLRPFYIAISWTAPFDSDEIGCTRAGRKRKEGAGRRGGGSGGAGR